MVTAGPISGNQIVANLQHARDVANQIAAHTGPAATPLPDFQSVQDGVRVARQAGDWLASKVPSAGCVYDGAIESASVLAKAGADALDTAALGMQTCSGFENREMLVKGSVVAAHTLDDALTTIESLPPDVLGIVPVADQTPCGH